jgi:iron complex transport system ATP-binding protein
MLSLHDIQVQRQGRCLLDIPSLQLDGTAFTVILGHNGSGKSTLMNVLARQLQPDRGQVLLNGAPNARLSARQFARQVAYLPQRLPDAAGLTVTELVALGRYPWCGVFGRWRRGGYRRGAAGDGRCRCQPVCRAGGGQPVRW